ncbi:MAG TPA: DUF4124 domain-containing protein [Steroidobacteraceae bacterium]
MLHRTRHRRTRATAAYCCAAAAIACLALWAAQAAADSIVYKWVDSSGVVHLSSDRPPSGVAYERMALTPTKNAGGKRATSSSGTNRLLAASSEQIANRNEIVSELQNRECVVALEAIDRLARGGQAVDADDFHRLQQTADRNCSKDPARRHEQEQMAAKLRVAKGDVCIDARNRLADMLEPGHRPTREQLKTQQEFIEAHCKAPVR